MIDPSNITNFDRTESELQEFLLFGICAAGKSSDIQAKKLHDFLSASDLDEFETPFAKISYLKNNGLLEKRLRDVKLGKYYLLVPSFTELSEQNPDLKNITRTELQNFTGIGPKTARFFILHSRKNANVACLDVHILKWIRENLEINGVPNQTPSGKKYRELERAFLDYANQRDIAPAVLDLKIWNYYSGNSTELVM